MQQRNRNPHRFMRQRHVVAHESRISENVSRPPTVIAEPYSQWKNRRAQPRRSPPPARRKLVAKQNRRPEDRRLLAQRGEAKKHGSECEATFEVAPQPPKHETSCQQVGMRHTALR